MYEFFMQRLYATIPLLQNKAQVEFMSGNFKNVMTI